MNLKFYLRIICVLGFTTSGIFTYMAYVPNSSSENEKMLGIAMTLVCQGGGFIFLKLIFEEKLKLKLKLLFAGLSLLLFFLSIIATVDYQAKREDKIESKSVVKSEKYIELKNKQAKENTKFSKLEIQIDKLTENIEKTKKQNKIEIDSILSDLNNSKTPQWRKEQIGLTLKDTKKTQSIEINEMNNNLNEMNNQYQNFKFTDIDENSIHDSANKSLYENVANYFGLTPNFVKTLMRIFFAVTFELTAICSHIALKKFENKNDIFDNMKNGGKRVIASIPKIDLTKAIPNQLAPAPQLQVNEFTNEDIKKYLKTMYENSKNDISTGYKKIGKLSSLNEGIAKSIHKYLQDNKIVQVENGRTKILKNREMVF